MSSKEHEAAPAAPAAALSEADLAHVARYEASKARLEGVRGDYVRRMPLYYKFFMGLVAAGLACFALGVLAGVWGTFSTVLVSVGGYGMLRARVWELEVEIAEVDEEIAHIRAGRPLRRRR